MDIRKETISSQKLCRFCLNHQNDSLSSLYDRIKAPKDAVPLSLKILSSVGIEVFPSDKMPQYICHRCKFFIDLSYRFKQICRHADENILQFIEKGKAFTAVPWPATLKKVYKAMKVNSNEVDVMETVTQSGDTVQVMAEEISDSEEGEDDNVYNVKVRDGPEEGQTIKVVTTDKDNGKKRSRKDSEEETAVLLPLRRPERLSDGRCWPCDECDCTYPLEQLLSLHKSQKHRVRNVSCTECDAKFFSKYDLFTHQLKHSADIPFQCVACDKKFKRLVLLKRHEKLIHSDLPQQICPNCPATFLSIEELEAHSQRHNVLKEKRHACLICDKRFHDKNILNKHIDGVHNKKTIFTCQYCNERFPTVSKLTKHVRAHAGERPYPCKHCDKSFIKSHHYTRHLRLKHSSSGGAFDSEPYRCEECEESFNTQDDLMYHSALHATRNLVCPLCQEKFDDVDTVTAHIKSHVNGNQFMCDFCELIFTSKEKLENHIERAHEDELTSNEQEMDQDETSMEMEEEEDDENSINLKEEGDHMVVEIKKADEFLLPAQEEEYKNDNTQSEDSEIDASYEDRKSDLIERALTTAMPALEAKVDMSGAKVEIEAIKQKAAPAPIVAKTTDVGENKTATILKKAEEIKRKVIEQQSSGTSIDKSIEKKPNNNNKVESSTTTSGPSEKSLRLLEKELQDLKRTSRNESSKTPVKPLESIRKRPMIHTSTPKTRNADKKDLQITKPTVDKTAPSEKRTIERRSTPKEQKDISKDTRDSKDKDTVNKDSKELKDTTTKDLKEIKEVATKETKEKVAVVKVSKETVAKESKEMKDSKEMKESKEAKSNVRDEKEDSGKEEISKTDKKESKDKENKTVVKNGVNEKAPEETVRRSTRPSKVKDYAKMIRDDQSTTDDSDLEQNDDDYQETEKPSEVSNSRRGRKSTSKSTPVVAPVTPASLPKKRGRPRKVQTPSTPAKVRKTESSELTDKSDTVDDSETPKTEPPKEEQNTAATPEESTEDASKTAESKNVVSPSGQTLKKVPIRALPPGVKPLPLPRTMGAGEVCEMQIGKKVVKVQKIVMTKAEVEAMAKKGLVEMKDGTMVLKQGIKLPESAALKSTLVSDGDKQQESPKKD